MGVRGAELRSNPATASASPPAEDPPAESLLLVELVGRAQAGDRAALEALAAALYPVVRGALGRRLRRDAPLDLEDLTQIAVARAVERVDRCRGAADHGVRAWARAVAWRVALEELRAGAVAVARRSLTIEDNDHDPTAEWDFGVTGDGVRDPDPDGPREWLARAAVEALDRMPQQVGVLFWMRLIEDASWPEIAGAFGTTTAGVKRRFQRAVRALRRALGPYLADRADRPPRP